MKATKVDFECNASKLAYKSRVFTVALAGCSSSGKTTAASILKAILDPFMPSLGNTNLSEEENERPIIHQDSFFYFQDKLRCPITTFETRSSDANFMEASSKAESKGYYFTVPASLDFEQPIVVTGPDTDCVEAVNFTWCKDVVEKVQMTGS